MTSAIGFTMPAALRAPTLRALAVTALLIAGPQACALAQPYPAPPPPGPPREAAIDTPTVRVLPNGVTVIVASRPDAALVTAELFVRAGAERDPPQRAGLAHLMTTLLTRGSTQRSAPALAQAAEALGSSIEPLAGWHKSGLAMTVAGQHLDAALALLSEALRTPAFTPAELARARGEALDALRVSMAEPGTLTALAAAQLVFGEAAQGQSAQPAEGRPTYGQPTYGHPAAGTPLSLPRILRADLLALHRQCVQPQHTVLVLAGGIDVERGARLALLALGDWTADPGSPPAQACAGAGAAAPAAAGSAANRKPQALLIDLPGAGQASVMLALPGIARSAADHDAGQVFNAVLGGGYSSRLNQEIRIKRGLSYGASSKVEARRDGGLIVLSAQTKAASAAEVAMLMRAQLASLAEAPVKADELEARKATLIGELSRSVETTAALARRVATLAIANVPLSELSRSVGAITQVSAAQVQGFAAAHAQHDQANLIVAGQASAIVDALRKDLPAGVELRVVPARNLDIQRLR